MLDQRLHEPGAAVDDDVAVLLLPQLSDFLHDVALQHRRVVPLGLIQSRGDDILGHAVELVGELAFPRWPGLGKALVGHAPQQQGLGRERFVELELVALVSAADLEAPTSLTEVLGPARVLHDAVQRYEFRYDDPSHGYSHLSVGSRFSDRARTRNSSVSVRCRPEVLRTA